MSDLTFEFSDLLGYIIAILSLFVSFWLHYKSKITELNSNVYKQSLIDISKMIHNVAFKTVLETKNYPSDVEGLSKQRDLLTSSLESIQEIAKNKLGDEILIGDYVYGDKLSRLELSSSVSDIWLFSHDLKPDIDEYEVLKIVSMNLAAGKKYHYIFPSDLDEEKINTFKNRIQNQLRKIKGRKQSGLSNLYFIPIDRAVNIDLFARGNIAIYEFEKEVDSGTVDGYMEIVLPNKRRGSLWIRQEGSVTSSLLYQFQHLSKQNSKVDMDLVFNNTDSEKSIIVKIVETPEEFEFVKDIRRKVFINEQGVTEEEEFDSVDEKECTHLIALSAGKPIGTLRFYPIENQVQIGRVCVLIEFRGKGIGKILMHNALQLINIQYVKSVVLESQLEKIGFYEKFGFIPYGDLFIDARIPHRKMVLCLDS
ncbi:GNAT family N-acetyltransferase [Pseudoalteromonas fenneropenaei]|uniref:GNAT family N-acetyltransferase n=1 Tax=Pseudoalteromonas fenneropenaei TaxID=1737459 RepID=A0ABV7CFT9_9GAMM